VFDLVFVQFRSQLVERERPSELREFDRPRLVSNREVPDVVVRIDSYGQVRGRSRRPLMPPSTAIQVPVVEPDDGEARYPIAAATSAAVTNRPSGWRASSAARSAAGSAADSSNLATPGVSAVPGLTAFTRIPSGKRSATMASVRESTAPLRYVSQTSQARPPPAVLPGPDPKGRTRETTRSRRRSPNSGRATTRPHHLPSIHRIAPS
jgi:hypothetical protein